MDELLSYYATRKETLTHAMEKNLVNEQHQRSFDVPAMKYDRIPMNEEEAKYVCFVLSTIMCSGCANPPPPTTKKYL